MKILIQNNFMKKQLVSIFTYVWNNLAQVSFLHPAGVSLLGTCAGQWGMTLTPSWEGPSCLSYSASRLESTTWGEPWARWPLGQMPELQACILGSLAEQNRRPDVCNTAASGKFAAQPLGAIIVPSLLDSFTPGPCGVLRSGTTN